METFDKSNLRSTTGTRGLVQPSTALTMKGRYDTADPRVPADKISANKMKEDDQSNVWNIHEPVKEDEGTQQIVQNDKWFLERISPAEAREL